MTKPSGFRYVRHRNGEIVIFHHGKKAAVLRGAKADKFLERLDRAEPQELMARVTGNYKRGNEKRLR